MDLCTEWTCITVKGTQGGWVIIIFNNHTWGCTLYVLDTIVQGNISGLTKWETWSGAGIYLGHSLFHSRSAALVLNPATGQVSPQFHVAFDDEFYTVPFMREGTIHTKWTYLVQRSSQSVTPENIDVKDTLSTPDIEEDPSEKTTNAPRVALENNRIMITLSQSVQQVQ